MSVKRKVETKMHFCMIQFRLLFPRQNHPSPFKFKYLKSNVVMKKMNRSQSSHRRAVVTEEGDSWIGDNSVLQKLPKGQSNLVNSYLDSNKQNNSLFQSISERNFDQKPKTKLKDLDPAQQMMMMQLREKCSRYEHEIMSKNEIIQELRAGNPKGDKTYNYSQKYYKEEIQHLKEIINKRQKQIEIYRHEYSSRNSQMDSINSEFSSKMQRDQRDKNLYIKEINQKAIEITHLQERTKYQKAEIQTLKICLEDKDRSVRDYQERVGQADMKKKKIEHYQSQIKERQQILKELQMQTQRLKEETDRKDDKIHQMRNQLTLLEQTIGSYDDKLKSMELSLIRIKEEKKIAEDKNQEILRQCNEWKQNYEDILKKRDEHQQMEFKLKTYESLNGDLNNKIMELTSQYQKSKIQNITLNKNLTKFQDIDKEMISLKKQCKEKEERIYELLANEKALKNLQQNYGKLRKEKDEQFVKIQQKTKENKGLAHLIEEQKGTIKSLEEQLLELQQNSQRSKERGDKIDFLLKQNNRLNTNLQDKINQIQKLQIKINNLDNKIIDKANQNLKTKAVVDQKQQQITEMKIQITDLRQRYETETNNRMMEQDKVVKCNQQNYVLKCSLGKLEEQKEQLLEQIDTLAMEHQEAIDALSEELKQIAEDKQQTQYLVASYKEKGDVLRKEVEENRLELAEWSQKEQQHRHKLTQLESLIAELQARISSLTSQKETMLDSYLHMKNICTNMLELKDK